MVERHYCLCLDSKIGARALAVWQMIMHLVVIFSLGLVMMRPNLAHHHSGNQLVAMERKAPQQQPLLGEPHIISSQSRAVINVNNGNGFIIRRMVIGYRSDEVQQRQMESDVRHQERGGDDTEEGQYRCRQRVPLMLCLTLVSFLFCYMLYVGVSHRRPALILPYFCMQIVDYTLSSLSLVCFVSYMPHVKEWLVSRHHIPFRHHLLHMHTPALAAVLLLSAFVLLGLKAFLMGIVWHAFRVVREEKREEAERNAVGVENASDDNSDVVIVVEGYNTDKEVLLPEYEKCITEESKDLMPPAYDEVKASDI